jgi:uncharacterized protein (TIGR03435 family)
MLIALASFAQGKLVAVGDQFPGIPIKNMVNAPIKAIDLSSINDRKIYIINMWGTWCAPCIPEMQALDRLQQANLGKMQVIAISDESTARLQKFQKQAQTKLWLASDTSALFYSLFGINSVGQSAIVKGRKIIAMVKTHSITQDLINDILNGKTVKSDATFKEKKINENVDVFGVDTTLTENFTVRGYMQGQRTSSISYNYGIFGGRRLSYFNSCLASLFKDAYEITSSDLLFYETDEKSVCNFEDKLSLYCFDLLVKPTQKDSLSAIFCQKLSQITSIKARIAYKTISVYVLTLTAGQQFKAPISNASTTSIQFSGKGYQGKGVSLATFSNYLSNEMGLVVDETGLDGKYDITTNMDMRTTAEVTRSVNELGLTLTKSERKMKVLVLYK